MTPPDSSQLATDHPSSSTLAEFVAGRLDDDASLAIEHHLSDCELCCQTLAGLSFEDPLVSQLRDLPDTVEWLPHGGYRSGPTGDAPVPIIPGYEIVREVGRGGMGVVYQAKQLSLHRLVALKMLLHGDYATAEQRVRFRLEAELAARVRHPNIVQVYEVGIHQGRAYLALEWIDGGTLADIIAQGPLSPNEAAGITELLAAAIHTAHCQGVFHRDLKPANILIVHREEGADPSSNEIANRIPKITDFGIAKSIAANEQITEEGSFLGTPDYLAPEQVAPERDRPLGPAVDIYSLGVCLYEMLSGRRPFVGETPWDTVQQVLRHSPSSIRRFKPDVPWDLEVICLKCLSKTPSQRYSTALALNEDLRRYREGRPILARPIGWFERTWMWSKRRPSLAAFVFLAAAVVSIGLPLVSFLWLQANRELQRADRAINDAGDSLYFNHIALAQNALESDNLGRAELLLERCLPDAGQRDRRDWEWRYLAKQGQADLVPGMNYSSSDSPHHLHDVAWSPDAKYVATAAGMPHGVVSGFDADAYRTIPGDISVWDLSSVSVVKTVRPERGAMYSVTWRPNSTEFFASGADGNVYLCDVTADNPKVFFTAREGASVHCVRLSPDGRYLFIGSTKGIHVWDNQDNREVLNVPKPFYGSQSVLFRGEGATQLIAETRENGKRSISAWMLSPGMPPTELPIRTITADHTWIAFGDGPNGTLLTITIGRAGIQAWAEDSEQLLYQHPLTGQELSSIAFGKNGWYATGDADGVVRVWDPQQRNEAFAIRGHHSGILNLAFSPDGKRIATVGKDRAIKIWSATDDPRGVNTREERPYVGEHVGGLAFRDDGNIVSIEHLTQSVHITSSDAKTKHSTHVPDLNKNSNNPRRDQALSPNGRWFAGLTADNANRIRVWDLEHPESHVDLGENPGRVLAVAWAENVIATSALLQTDDMQKGSVLRISNAKSGDVLREWTVSGFIVLCLGLSSDGQLITGAMVDPDPQKRSPTAPTTVVVWESQTGNEVKRFDGATGLIASLAFSPDGKQLAAAAYHAGELRVWDVETGEQLFINHNLLIPTCVTFSPNGRRIATNGFDNRVRLWDSKTGREVITLPNIGSIGTGDYNFTARVVFSRDGRRIAAGNWDGSINIWDGGEDFSKQ